ncbi:MAG: hypothetical protein MJ181_10065 [Treponema sp.]|nr:hypothetical protein [Lachnospiraceae bacterium]MCQ2598176.1 hypothetical protein [Treponema sp.]
MLTEEELKGNIAELKSLNQQRRFKYYRNYSLYNNTKKMDLENIKNPSCAGFDNLTSEVNADTTPTPSLNVIKSCIDTLHSKIAQSKVRPYFNCINGSYQDICIVKQAQQFFDQYFDIEDVNKKVSEAFRDSCIFDTGYCYIDPDNKAITRALPYQVYERPAEITYNNITRTYYERKYFPVTMLDEKLSKKIKEKNIKYVTYGVYYDVVNKTKAHCLPDLNIYILEGYDGNRTPFVRIHYNNPIMGNTSLSVVDMLFTIQLEINSLMNKIKDASQLNPAMTFFVPEGSNIKSGSLNNKVGNIVQYTTTPNMTGSPVTVAAPAFIDSQYISLVEQLKNQAYEMVGVSQLSAQSKNIMGANASGLALQTMENVESDRFETQLNQVIRAYVDIAKTCLRVFPKDENILPEDSLRLDIKWADIVEEVQKMQIQFSAADSLSKDPSTKLQQLLALSQAGVIPQSRISQFMEIPDLQGGFSISNNSINAVLSIIDDCIKNDIYEIPEYIPLDMLCDEILNTQLSLRAANYERNRESIEKLSKLYDVATEQTHNLQQSYIDQQTALAEGQNAPMGEEIPQEQLPIGEGSQVQPDIGNIPVDNSAFNSDLDMNTQNV